MKTNDKNLQDRRELKTRNSGWAKRLASMVASSNISPNQISVLSVVCALGAMGAYWQAIMTENRWYLLLAALGIQLRLLCNMLDGLVAIEFRKKSKLGDLYNEIPDRLGDAVILLGAGIYLQKNAMGLNLAWANVFMATFTAYIRALGASLGKGHKFLGPMAKQHRMFVLTVGTLIEAFAAVNGVFGALWVMALGLVITLWRRTSTLAKDLNA